MVCIDGLEDSSNPPKLATPPAEVVEERAETDATSAPVESIDLANEPEMFSTGSEVMDDILEHSQQRMLEAFSQLSRRVDGLAPRGQHLPVRTGVDMGLSMNGDLRSAPISSPFP